MHSCNLEMNIKEEQPSPRENGNEICCAICCGPDAINHFGAVSCRACGAFFRRLVVSKRNYRCTCEDGKVEENNMENDYKDGLIVAEICKKIFNCRGCRLQRCLRAGMQTQAVKSATLREFHRERKKFLAVKKGQHQQGRKIIDIMDEVEMADKFTHHQLAYIGAKLDKIYGSCKHINPNYLNSFHSLEQLLLSTENLLSIKEDKNNIYFIPTPMDYIDVASTELLARKNKNGLWSRTPTPLIRDLIVIINVAKALPAFSQLDLHDQVSSVSAFSMAAFHLVNRLHAMRRDSKTIILPENSFPVIKFHTQLSTDLVIKKLADAVFTHPMDDFMKVSPNGEEFPLLLALLFYNSANPSLSRLGQQTLNKESEKCARILLRLQQRQFGEQSGALRFSESLQLIWSTISSAQKHRQMIVYIDSLYQPNRFESVMPRILVPLVIQRELAPSYY